MIGDVQVNLNTVDTPKFTSNSQGGQGNDTFNSKGQADVYVPGRGNDTVNLQNDDIMQTIVYRFDSSGDEWTATDGKLTINNFKIADANGVAGDRLVLVDINPNNPYRSMDAIFDELHHNGNNSQMKFQFISLVVGTVHRYSGFKITFGDPDRNNTIIINFEESILKNTFDDRKDELDYGNHNHKNAHVIFGDTGFLLDPYYDSKITVYEDAVPDLI